MRQILTTLLLVGGLLSSQGLAATQQVSQQGSDSAPCGQGARRTINGGIACLRSGDTLLIAPGTYDEMISDSGCNPGYTCVAPPSGTTLKAALPGTVTLRASRNGGDKGYLVTLESSTTQQVRVEGLVLDAELRRQGITGCGSTWAGTDIQFVGVECTNAMQGFVGGGPGLVFDRVYVHGTGGGLDGGLTCYGGGDGSEPYQGYCHGFYFQVGAGAPVTIRNSRIEDINGYGIQSYLQSINIVNTSITDVFASEVICVNGGCARSGTGPVAGVEPPPGPSPSPAPATGPATRLPPRRPASLLPPASAARRTPV